jgi:glycerol uptake facilitator-like aquaporin
VPAYVAAQFVGAIGAAAVLRALFAAPEKAGSTYPHGSVGQSLGLEIVLTALVVFVTLNAATRHRLLGPDAALATGAVTAAARFIGLAVSGASMNPARSLGPALVAGFGLDQWIYVVGPTIGALIAVGVTALCHGPAQREEHDAAEGDDNRGSR